MPRLLYLLFLLILAVGCRSTSSMQGAAGANAFAFALIGDVPYAPADSLKFARLQAAINADASVQWVLHTGDIKRSSQPCSDAFIRARLRLYQRFERPFVITPGDNEWTDCHRRTGAGEYQPLERLAFLRSVFFAEPGRTLGQQPMRVITQASDPAYATYPEHVRWSQSGILFATMHLVGSFNGLAPFPARTAADDQEVADRTAAAIAWLREAFAEAERLDSPGVFLMIHANPAFEALPGSPARTGFEAFIEALATEVIAFGKPVVLAHGDSHYFRIDKPLTAEGKRVHSFTRVESFGDADVHWLKVTVDPNTPQVFHIEQQILPENRHTFGSNAE